MHSKMLSAEVVCYELLPNITDEFKHRSKQRGSKSDCSYEQSDLDPHSS